MTAPLTLHIDGFWANPWDCTVWVALREKELPFSTSIALLRDGMGLVGPIRDLSVTGRAPTLQQGDFWLSESLAIVEFLEEAYPPPDWPALLPRELVPRARARQVLSWLRTEMGPLRRDRPSQLVFYPGTPSPLAPDALQTAGELVRVATQLGAGPSGRLFGEFTVADADLAFMLMRLVKTGHELPAPLVAYAEAVWAHPSVREYVNHRRPPYPPE